MRTIRLTKTVSDNATLVEVFEDAVLSQMILINDEQSLNLDIDGLIHFQENLILEKLILSVDNLHADTKILLSNPIDGFELLTAIANIKLFSHILDGGGGTQLLTTNTDILTTNVVYLTTATTL